MLPILNADDYSMSHGISDAIEILARTRRLSATSAMTNMPLWPAYAPRLRDLRNDIAVGIHLNLTYGKPLTELAALAPCGDFPGRAGFLRLMFANGIKNPTKLRDEIRRQLDSFEKEMKCPPDHIDGHEHVHAFPIVRTALIDEIRARWPSPLPLIRSHKGSKFNTKSALVSVLTFGFHRSCAREKILCNTYFGGYSTFNRQIPYQDEINAELNSASAPNRIAIIMCHPGLPDARDTANDSIKPRRHDEYSALSSMPDLPTRIWHPERERDGSINWHKITSPGA